MALRKGLPAKLAATDADDTRYDLSGLIVCNVDGTPRGGVLSPVGVNLVTATATMNVSVARFQGAAVRDAGVVLLANDGPTNVLLANAPAANSRLDVVYAKQNDASGTVSVPDANNLPAFGVLQGAAAPIPVRNPAGLPAGAVELATVQIPSTATATNSPGVVITQTAQFTASAGGVVPFRTKAELDLWTTAAVNQLAFVSGDGVTYRNNGTSFVPESGYASASLARSTDLAGGSGTSPTPAAFQSAPALRGMTWAVGQPSRLGCLIPGRYLMQAIGAAGSTSSATAWLRINGTTNRTAGPSIANVAGISIITLTDVLTLAVGDYVELMTQTNGAFNLYAATSLNADLINPR